METALNTTPGALVDFHTHSEFSDGVLSPEALVQRAAGRGVGSLALTDHDTTAGLARAAQACAAHQVKFIAGIELSSQWRGQSIHLIGLNVNASDQRLQAHNTAVLARRHARIAEIGARLQKRARLPGEEMAAEIAVAHTAPTRLHIARWLVSKGLAKDTQSAFDQWLNRDGAGHVPIEWPALADTIAVLRGNGADVVMAHPHRYRLSSGGLRELVAAFVQAGGVALEASIAGMSLGDADRIASLCRRFTLNASFGSDFHDPAVPWNPLGRWLKLADGLVPITARWQQ
jgi:predicted metal-dependent phosphoesterase TrpH